MKNFVKRNDKIIFWVVFIIASIISYGGFTYLYSIASPPTEAELILKISQ
ncbi:hypothetical protein IT418_01205 [bacterium]|nr:hypothetical protein [bacterium]